MKNFRFFSLIVFTLLVFIQPVKADDKPVFDILFIGNSYTFSPDIPQILASFINSNPNSPIRVHTDSSVAPSLHIKDQWERGEPLQKIRSKNWHYVVLQNQSNWPCFPQMRKDFLKYGRMFADEISGAEGVPIIPETWPKEPGSQYYKNIPQIQNFAYMHARLRKHTPEVAAYIGAGIVPINYYWVKAMEKAPDLRLYRDGSHLSQAGAYLVTLVYYKYFTGQNYQNPKSILQGVSDLEARALQNIVASFNPPKAN